MNDFCRIGKEFAPRTDEEIAGGDHILSLAVPIASLNRSKSTFR